MVLRFANQLSRSISVSTDVFAAIWAHRQPGEETESDILARLLGVEAAAQIVEGPSSFEEMVIREGVGWADARYGVRLSPGTEVFRTYRGTDYRAKAVGGFLILNTGVGYRTLNELSNAIGAKNENAWLNWFYDDGGKRRPLADRRDPAKVVKRPKRESLEDAF